jgi:FkbM family methyltransferase
MKIVDVGANKGDFSVHALARSKENVVYAIEPNLPECAEILQNLQDKHPDNFIFFPKALSKISGTANLYSPDVMGGQIASLLRVNQSGAWNPTVTDRIALEKKVESIEVETSTVAEFLDSSGLIEIDFLKIDVQGSDLDILEDFLKLARVNVAAIEIEISSIPELRHYQDSTNDIQRLVEILNQFDFKVIRMMPGSGDCREYNVFVAKSFESFQAVNAGLDFSSSPVFARYWEVLGVGEKSTDLLGLQKSIFYKLKTGIFHPIQSYRSALIKLTS